MDIYQLDEEKNEKGEKILLGDNIDWGSSLISAKKNFYTGVKNLPGASFKGNFAMPYDRDIFYYQAKKTELIGVTIDERTITDTMKATYAKDLLSMYAGVTVIIEDRNNNRKIDEEEYNYVHVIDKGIWGHLYGSFNAKKGKNYFIMMEPMMNGNVPMSIVPYTFTLASAPKLSAGQEIDGVISVYKNGKLVFKSDYYSSGDAEIIPFNLKKGKYHIKVQDVNGNASMKPYKLSISTK